MGRSPSLAYLKYLKLQYWISWCVLDLMMFGVVIAAFVAHPLAGIFVLMLALPVIVLPQLWSYVALHLQYDSTWYLLTPRSMRLRRGIWVIKETTITFENVQNVSLQQGPLQRFLGFGNVSVETAGGAAMGPHGAQGGGHHGLLEGLSDAPQVRDLIMQRVRQSQSAGLGDEKIASRSFGKPVRAFTSSQLDLLREIRDLTARLRVS